MKLRLSLILSTLSLLLSFAQVNAQDQFTRGPQINDALPQGPAARGSNLMTGPRSPAFFRPYGGGNNWLQNLTSGNAVFDNGTILAGIGADAGLNRLGIGWGSGIQGSQTGSMRDGCKVGVGPLTLSDFTLGLGTFYTDFNTPQGIRDASGWSSVISLGATVNLALPWLSFGGQVSGFYLPFIDKWGYGTPSPLLSFGASFGQFSPTGSMGLGIKGSLAGWNWIVYDAFNAGYGNVMMTDYIFDGAPNSSANARLLLPSATAVDQVGRYQFAFAGGAFADRPANATSRFQAPRFGNNGSLLSQDRSFFTNSSGAMAGRMLSDRVRNFYWLQRDDFWATRNFISLRNFIRGGAYADFQSGNPYINPYIGYEFGTGDEFASLHQMVNAGSYGYLSPSTSYYANLGWVWGTGPPNSISTALYELVVSQTLSSRFSHSVGGGRTVTDPMLGERFIADYLSYYLNFCLNSHTMLQAIGGVSNTYGALTGSGDATRNFQGIRLRSILGQSNISLSAIHESFDFKGGGPQQIDQWVYKILYGLPIGGYRTTAYTGYQYIDRRATGGIDSFQEHLFLLYITQQF